MKLSISQDANEILQKRYLKKNHKGIVVETPEELFERVAKTIASADRRFDPKADINVSEKKFLEMLTRLWFLPNSPTLINAGRSLGQLAACFVLPVNDTIESIFETLKHAVMIHKSGGGTGFCFSKIRPAKDKVLSTAGISSGPVSFMNIFDVSTEIVSQGGIRRGANMGILRVDHPDIKAFIKSKNDLYKLNNFNISVGITDHFMDMLKKNENYDLINPRTGKTAKTIQAKKIFNLIVNSAWLTGEPGIVFIDRINAANPTPFLGKIEATNPCGEQPLLAYESCTLGSINLSKMLTQNRINFNRIKSVVHEAVHFLDNVIEINKYPLLRIEKASKATRKIGIGVMGFADMLIHLKIPYNSDEAVHIAESVMSCISDESKKASADLGKKRGNFPAYKKSIYDNPGTPYMRNATTTTIAPTGTLSIIAETSSGIEPLFAIAYERSCPGQKTFFKTHPAFIKTAKKEGFYKKKLINKIVYTGSVMSIDGIPEHIKRLFVTSHDIPAEWHIKIQSAFQKYTDNAVSKTINLPSDISRKEVAKAYLLAHENGCKGVTIYRYTSRIRQILNIKDSLKNNLTI